MRIVGIITAFALAAFAGCAQMKGAKITEGTDLAAGIDIPAAEGIARFTLLNYLSGFRLGVDQNARLTVDYTVDETNSYCGCITTRTRKTIHAVVEPCVVTKEDDGTVEAATEPTETQGCDACGSTDCSCTDCPATSCGCGNEDKLTGDRCAMADDKPG